MSADFVTTALRFGLVGMSGMLVDFGATWLLKERLRVNKFVANSVGFLLAATSNYLLNRVWTFRSDDPEVARQYATFLTVSVVGLLLNNLILYLLHERAKLPFYISKLIAIGMVTLWNFLANYYITF